MYYIHTHTHTRARVCVYTYMCVCVYIHIYVYTCIYIHTHECSVAQSCLTLLRPHRLQPARFVCPWDSLGKDSEVGCHFHLQGIFLTQGLNLCLLHWQGDSLSLTTREAHIYTHTHTNVCVYI